MYWLLQDKFNHDPKYRELINNLERLGIEHSMCKVIPFTADGIEFSDGVSYESLKDKPVFTYGSYTLAKIAKKYFKPASYISPKIGIDQLLEHYKDEMLNNDMVIAPLEKLDPQMDRFFIRPVEDSKSFCGELMDKDQFVKWRDGIIELSKSGYIDPSPETECIIASPKQIDKEYRFFIVHGQIATCSQYRCNGNPMFIPDVEPYVKDYVINIINCWRPDHAFCLDIATTDGVPKVIEANCINASGMYAIDTQKFIMAVESLEGYNDEYDHNIRLIALPTIR